MASSLTLRRVDFRNTIRFGLIARPGIFPGIFRGVLPVALTACLVVFLVLAGAPAYAKDSLGSQELEGLIPDAAVERPEDWAQQQATDQGQGEADTTTPALVPNTAVLDPDSPLAGLPQFQTEWSNDLQLEAIEGIDPLAEGETGNTFANLPQLKQQETPEINLVEINRKLVLGFPIDAADFPEQPDFISRFRALSTIEGLGNSEQNIAQLSARAREDEELLQRLMRNYGYYNAQIIRGVGTAQRGDDTADTRTRVRFDIIPGERYDFGTIILGTLSSAPDAEGLRAAFEIVQGDPLNSDKLVEEQRDLDAVLGENGYPFAEIADPELLVDHSREEGDLTMPVTPGGKYVFGQLNSSDPAFLSSKQLARIARFDPGDTYRRSLELDLRRAIVATGLVSTVAITPRELTPPTETEPGEITLDVDLQKAKLRTIAGAIGYGSEDGVKLEASWEHRNLFPPEGSLKVRGIVGTQEQLFGVSFKKNNFKKRDQVLFLDAYASDIESEAVAARSVALRSSFERVSNLLFQRPFSWSVGSEVLLTDERNRVTDGVERPRETFVIAGLFGSATLDASDSLLDPTEGFRVTGYLAPEVSRSNGTEVFYLRGQADASYYQPVGSGTVLATRGRFATIQGADTFQIAPSRRLYAGGGSSVRGYGYQAVGPRDEFDDPTGGRSLVEFSLEARIDTGLMDGAVQIVPFVDAGSVSFDSTPDFRSIKFGAGLGLRYKTGFGPIRVDVGVPLNPDPDDSPVAVYVSLGQAF